MGAAHVRVERPVEAHSLDAVQSRLARLLAVLRPQHVRSIERLFYGVAVGESVGPGSSVGVGVASLDGFGVFVGLGVWSGVAVGLLVGFGVFDGSGVGVACGPGAGGIPWLIGHCVPAGGSPG